MNINWRSRDEELDEFISAYVTSFASWDLILFIHYNSAVMDTADGFSNRLGRSPEDVGDALEHFCRLGCMSKTKGGSVPIYTPAPTKASKEMFAKFVRAQEDRELRLMLIQTILRKGRTQEKERP